jgi:tagatose-6-phosphate ketose/aldose isomerase
MATRVYREFADTIESVGRDPFTKAVFLASGDNRGAERDGALKMLEMSAGRVSTMAETYLGLRHGPMSWLDANTLVVALRSAGRIPRAYEDDLLSELAAKRLGRRVLTTGPGAEIECGDAPILHVVVLQLLAFFRCLSLGLEPDSPSPEGVITRVVAPFRLHGVPPG